MKEEKEMHDIANQTECGKGVLGSLGNVLHDPMETMTCGQNLERKIAEQKERLAALESALIETKETGLYNVKISTLLDLLSY